MSKVRLSKSVLFLTVLCLVLSIFITGCSSKTADNGQSSAPAGSSSSSGSNSSGGSSSSNNQGTVAKDAKLTFWIEPDTEWLATAKTFNETPIAAELEKRTGVKVEYIHPAVGQTREQFNLMIASNELPDIIVYNWTTYPGGISKAFEDNVIIPLNEYFDKGMAPNFFKVLGSTEFEKLAKTDDGKFYAFTMIKDNDPSCIVWQGPVLRRDWLEELGLEVPTTIDEWYVVLKTIKENKNTDATLSFLDSQINTSHDFVGAYGTTRTFFQEDGVVKYGPLLPAFKDFLATFSKWYADGLIDPDYITQDKKTYDAKVLSGRTGAFLGTPDGYVGTYIRLAREENPDFDLVPAPHPTLNKGETPKFMQKEFNVSQNYSAAITSQCKQVEVAVKWLDYLYSDEGRLLLNFGIEGTSYELVDGQPKYTDLIKNNPDKLTMKQAMARYAICALGRWPGVQMKEPVREQRFYPAQDECVVVWSKAEETRRMPPLTLTPDESKRYAQIMTEIDTYFSEMYNKIVTGQLPVSEYDNVVENMKKMGIEEAIKINQAALDRFNQR